MILHNIDITWLEGIELPPRMNNPLDYEPHPLCIEACKRLQSYLAQRKDWRGEIDRGKMFGVLVVETPEKEVAYLTAYSGQIGGRSDWDGFVPAVFDYLQPDGYFKQHESEISDINLAIHNLEHDERMEKIKRDIDLLKAEHEQTIHAYRQKMKQAKAQRDARRQEGDVSEEEEADMTRQSQHMKAELRRLKKSLAQKTAIEEEYEDFLADIKRLRQLRKTLSDALQRWLFSQFRMLNCEGEHKNLLEIFKDTAAKVPPAGSGECCEPKLLQYAYSHGYRPVQMAMFWWGESPKEEIRHHLHYYPACNGKCKPILGWMLPEACETWKKPCTNDVRTLFEDHEIAVVCKPAGMLSVPGKCKQPSVYTLMRQRYPQATGPLIVHRLDMATSGLMVIAKTEFAYHRLQEQFANHQVEKRYVAIVCCQDKGAADRIAKEGTISLPLMPDYQDRPRQIVSRGQGKEAVTKYRVLRRIDDTHLRLALHPKTGRTHQLRVHCAHREGLDAPILGDPLYGREPASRLYLHAEAIRFEHPLTGKNLYIESLATF